MKYKILKLDANDKISFTEDELTKLLDDVYEDGYAAGSRGRYYTWAPTWTSGKITSTGDIPTEYTTITCNNDNQETTVTCNCKHEK